MNATLNSLEVIYHIISKDIKILISLGNMTDYLILKKNLKLNSFVAHLIFQLAIESGSSYTKSANLH